MIGLTIVKLFSGAAKSDDCGISLIAMNFNSPFLLLIGPVMSVSVGEPHNGIQARPIRADYGPTFTQRKGLTDPLRPSLRTLLASTARV